jgi:putative FmdB family regulatory protein
MPIFEYACRACGTKFEQLIRNEGEVAALACPKCGAPAPEKQFSTFAPKMGASKSAAPPMCPSSGMCPNAGKCGMG